nr:hypothetical protein [uncultured Flavobacterium sp.]
MRLLRSRPIALRHSKTLEYLHCNHGDTRDFDAREHIVILREYDDGVVLEHEKTGKFLSFQGLWVESTYKDADRLSINYCKKNSVRYLQLLSKDGVAKKDVPDEFIEGSETLLLEERDECEIKLNPLGTFKNMSDVQIKSLDKAISEGGSLLDIGYKEQVNSKLLGSLMDQLGGLSDTAADAQWTNMVTDAGTKYSFTKLDNAKIYVWHQPKLSIEGMEVVSEINNYRKEHMGDHEDAESFTNEFVVIYKAGDMTSYQKYIGYSEFLGNTLLHVAMTQSLVRLINYTCRKFVASRMSGVISKAMAEGAEMAMTQSRWYVRFWRFRATQPGRYLIGGFTQVVAIAAVAIALYYIFKFIKVPQQVIISVYNRTNSNLQCSVSYLDNVQDHYYPTNEHPSETNNIAAMKQAGSTFTDPDIPGYIEDGSVVSFGQYQMENDNQWFEGLGCLLKIETEIDSTFVSYNRFLIPWSAVNKMNIGTDPLPYLSRKDTYNTLSKGERMLLNMQGQNNKWLIKQSINALTGADHKYTSCVGVYKS